MLLQKRSVNIYYVCTKSHKVIMEINKFDNAGGGRNAKLKVKVMKSKARAIVSQATKKDIYMIGIGRYLANDPSFIRDQ